MKIIFFAVPYRGHLQPNLPLLRSLLERGHSLTILGGEDFLRRNLADKDLTTRKAKGGGLQFQPLPDYLVQAYQLRGQQVPGQETAAEDFYSYLYKEEKIQRQEVLIGSLQDRFFSDYGTWVREEKADWIFYDTYAFYSSKIVEQYAEQAVQINSAVWEADKYFQSDSWRAYLEEIVLPELADAWAGDTLQELSGIPSIEQLLRRARRRFHRRGREGGRRQCCALQLAYHSPSLQNEWELLDDRYGYLGFPGEAHLYPEEKGKCIYLSRGTMASAYDRQLLCRTLEGFKDTGWEIDVSTGGQAELPPRAGRIRVHGFCDQAAMLRRAGAFVSHGGISGVREAIFCETPILVIPSNFQDYQVGKALERAGAGRILTRRPLTDSAIREQWESFCQDYEEMREGVRELKWEMRSWWDSRGILSLCRQLGS